LELTLGSRTGGGFGARPAARRLFTQRRTVGFGSHASRVALGGGADSLALRATVFLAHVFGAADRTFGLFAVHRAFGTFRLLALHLAFRASTDGVADRRARRVVALPATSRVAVLLATFAVSFGFGFGVHLGRRRRDYHHRQ